jgi:mannose-1-phosphate guanylyltransferase
MDRPLVAVVLAGGTGTRLYPASRSDDPKQFHRFGGERSLLAATVDRAGFADEVYVLTRPAFADAVRDHAPNAAVLTEPEPKDTGPALAYAAHRVREQVGDCAMVCLPSDHHVGGGVAATARSAARTAVETGGLVTVGVEPTRPATGYGYVEPGERFDGPNDGLGGYYAVDSFVEKPDADSAEAFLDRGFYWNAGIFAWTPTALLEAARATPLEPLCEALDRGEAAAGFAAVDAVSVDYAVLERVDDVFLVPATFEWDDLGTWDALGRVLDSDESGTVAVGDAHLDDARDCVVATDGHVSAVGVSDLVIASYGDRTLVVPKSQSQRVRDVVGALREDDLF